MSRSLTSAQIISLGEYLEPDFDAGSLTVSQLLGIFGYHNIKYPAPYTKPKLVQLFNEEVKPMSKKFKRDRLKRENSIASDDGIKDGVTGRYINEDAQPLRRSTRRGSRAPSLDSEVVEVKPEPVPQSKRRRSSAKPDLGGPPRHAPQPQEPLIEESEPEESEEEVPVRKERKGKKKTDAKNRRYSTHDDSGWEDNNIFQSGAESSSPVRPSPVKPRTTRKSNPPKVVPRRSSRKAESAPPEMSPSPTRKFADENDVPLPPAQAPLKAPKFEPVLSPDMFREEKIIASGGSTSSPFKPPSGGVSAAATPFKLLKSPVSRPPLVEQQTPSFIRDARDDEELEEVLDDTPSTAFNFNFDADTSGFADVSVDAPGDSTRNEELVDEEKGGEAEVEESKEAKETAVVSRPLAETGTAIVKRAEGSQPRTGRKSIGALLLFIAISLFSLIPYQQESASIGFCDAGSDTNSILEGLRTRRAAAEACIAENRTLLYVSPITSSSSSAAAASPSSSAVSQTSDLDQPVCPPPSILPVPSPDACTPCPDHAQCEHNNIVCDSGYIVRPHPVLGFLPFPMTNSLNSLQPYLKPSAPTRTIISAVSAVFDGLPGLGPVAFPPHCIVDPRRKKHIGVLGKAVEAVLGQERGKKLCAGDTTVMKDADGGEAKRWGLEIRTLKEDMKKKTRPDLQDTFDDTFDEAIEQLTTWGGVFTSTDSQGHKFIAHNIPDLDWTCTITVKSREGWHEWRATFGGVVGTVLALLYARSSLRQRAIDNKRVAELVQIALDTLRNQELRHHTDPVSEPQPYLSSLQLRDQILQDEHSVKRRQYLWDKVERVVEGNTNVRANLEEVEGGDELRVWRWVGGGSRRKSVKFDDI